MSFTRGTQALWTGDQARAVDALSIERYGLASLDLMELAGRALFETCLELRRPYQSFLILAGPGNNGGDALVAARLLQEAGFGPQVWSLMAPQSQESPQRARERLACEKLGMTVPAFSYELLATVSQQDLFVVDGVLGLGLKQSLRAGFYQDALAAIAKLNPACVLAVDLPSGLPADTWGTDLSIPLPAHYTLSFGAAKLAHRLSPARELCGKLILRDIGFSKAAEQEALRLGPHCFESPHIAREFKPWQALSPAAHKYIRGHGLVIGGSPGKVGASYLTAQGALRAGAGWITLAPMSEQLAPARVPSLTYEEWALLGSIEEDVLDRFILQRKVRGLVLGPGCMESPLTPSLMQRLARLNREYGLFLVFDAGALKNWRMYAQELRFVPERTLLTPHPGEWLAIDPSHHQGLESLESLHQAWDFCREFGVTVFYKSASPFALWTLEEQNFLCLNADGDQRLARAGSGDLLAGICLTLGMQGIPAAQVAPLAQSILAEAIERASATQSPHGLTAEELFPYLA